MHSESSLIRAQLELLRECMYGVGDGMQFTEFVQQKEAILPTLRAITAEEASQLRIGDGPTIASHAYHIRYMLQGANGQCGDGPMPAGDWESSWSRASVSEVDWPTLVDEIEARYRSLAAWIRAQQNWENDDIAMGSLAILPHLAYHLGAIRQLFRLKK